MVRYLRAANVKDGVLDLSDVKSMNFEPKEQRKFALQPGDVLVTEGSGSLRAVGASAVWQGEIEGTVCFQNTLLRLRPRSSTDPRFLGWWCRYAFAGGVFASIASGANIFHVSADRVRSLRMTYLPLAEQRAIADYLDTETAHIDALITKKRRMVELLEERTVAEARSRITGSQVSGPRKPSGFEWLGDVPALWQMVPVGAAYEVVLGRMLNAERESAGDQRPYLRNINIRWGSIETGDLATMDFPPSERHKYQLRRGDLLVCEGGAGYARAAVWDGSIREMYYQKSLHRVRSRGRWPVEWLIDWLYVGKTAGGFEALGNLATIPHLTAEQLRMFRIPWPTTETCLSILASKARSEERGKILLQRVVDQIVLLQEHRQALITAAVTGESDVGVPA